MTPATGRFSGFGTGRLKAPDVHFLVPRGRRRHIMRRSEAVLLKLATQSGAGAAEPSGTRVTSGTPCRPTLAGRVPGGGHDGPRAMLLRIGDRCG